MPTGRKDTIDVNGKHIHLNGTDEVLGRFVIRTCAFFLDPKLPRVAVQHRTKEVHQ